jgi:hypothetical protein
MEDFLLSVAGYLLQVVLATLQQLLILAGPLLVLAILMHFVSKGSQYLSYRLFGNRLFLGIFGWFGTAVHELGHALFALVFFHKITGMKLFSPDHKKGTLGYVNHSWNSKNLYQVVGNFFIGIGPVLMGSIMLYLITWLLFFRSTTSIAAMPETGLLFSGAVTTGTTFAGIFHGFADYLYFLFSGPGSSWWKLIIFLYLVYSIGSSITLSMEDIRGALKGFLVFVLLLLVFNLATVWIGGFTLDFFRKISNLFTAFYFLIILSILLNVAFILILMMLLAIRKWILHKVEAAG